MKVFKNKTNGFTLIEVLLALAIIGLVLTPIFLIQNNVLRSSARVSHYLARIFAAKQFLIETEFDLSPQAQEFSREQKIENPPTTLVYALKKIPENSSLKKFKHILLENVTMQWVDQAGKKRSDALVTFLYKPEVR